MNKMNGNCVYYPSAGFNNKNHMDFANQQFQSTNYSFVSVQPPLPLMSDETIRPPSLLNVVPHERESWIRSVKKTKINNGIEQKTQYLETMLRMPQQQKSLINSSTFDRIRFADDRSSTMTNTTDNNNNLEENSYHFIADDSTHTVDLILFNKELQSENVDCITLDTPNSPILDSEPTLETNPESVNFSGFLIDNCDEAVPSPVSPPLHSTIEESTEQIRKSLSEQRLMLINELDTAAIERREKAKRRKRLYRKLQRQKKKEHLEKMAQEKQIISTVNHNTHHQSSSDWIIEYDMPTSDRISQLTDTIKNRSTTMTDRDKFCKINQILRKIKTQQKKLRHYVTSILNEEQISTNTTQQNSNGNQDLLKTFLNQPLLSGCWLCSGKTYTEVSTQCNSNDH